ncbi:MAG: regulator, partial [Candidatus Thioglobus sp.]|nr:regulator [Candidatus Thioglobus sp.]
MSQAIITSESTLTDRYQTTVPDVVRKALHLHKREKIRYTVESNGDVRMSRAKESESDPILENFLEFLAQDIKHNPSQLELIDKKLVGRIESLIEGV